MTGFPRVHPSVSFPVADPSPFSRPPSFPGLVTGEYPSLHDSVPVASVDLGTPFSVCHPPHPYPPLPTAPLLPYNTAGHSFPGAGGGTRPRASVRTRTGALVRSTSSHRSGLPRPCPQLVVRRPPASHPTKSAPVPGGIGPETEHVVRVPVPIALNPQHHIQGRAPAPPLLRRSVVGRQQHLEIVVAADREGQIYCAE